jgi:hypothetical protein
VRKTLSVSILVLGLLLPNVAVVSARRQSQPSDSSAHARDPEGEVETKLDFVFVSFEGHGDGTATLTIRTKERWACRYLRNEPLGDYSDGDGAFMWWDMDRNGDDNFERAGNFHCRAGNQLVMEMSDSGETYRARRPNRRSAVVSVPLRGLRLDVSSLQLQAKSQVNGVSEGKVFFEEGDSAPVLSP